MVACQIKDQEQEEGVVVVEDSNRNRHFEPSSPRHSHHHSPYDAAAFLGMKYTLRLVFTEDPPDSVTA